MRTTIDVNDAILREAKRRAVEEGGTLKEVIERALRQYLGKGKRSGYRLRWRTERGRLQPGVRLDDRDALWDLMEERR
jgi:hypothetical protein